jgi:hypothetical protein
MDEFLQSLKFLFSLRYAFHQQFKENQIPYLLKISFLVGQLQMYDSPNDIL